MRENCLSGSTSGMWKRSMVRIMRHRLTKGPETARPDLTHRATSRLYQEEVISGLATIRSERERTSETALGHLGPLHVHRRSQGLLLLTRVAAQREADQHGHNQRHHDDSKRCFV